MTAISTIPMNRAARPRWQLARGLLICATLLTVALGCRSMAARVEPGDPIVAVSNFLHPPFSSLDETGTPVGLEIDLVHEAAKRLGRTVEWVELPFSELLDAVAEGRADLASATVGITPERGQRVGFSRPYFETRIVALARFGAAEPRTLAELAGRRIATDRGTTAVGAARRSIPEAIRVLDRPPGATWAEQLTSGAVDAIVLDESHADKFMADAGIQLFMIPQALQIEHFGFAHQRQDDRLHDALDAAIADRLD